LATRAPRVCRKTSKHRFLEIAQVAVPHRVKRDNGVSATTGH
jgi:hypothetical protein